MAKDITMKRYDATINPTTNAPIGWVELNPTTKATLVTGKRDNQNRTDADVQTILDEKQTKANLTNTISESTTQYPTVGLLKSQIESVVEIAEGRTATFVTTLFPHTANSETTYYLVGGTSAITEETTITWGTTGLLFAAVNPGESSIDASDFETAGGSGGDPAYLYMIYKDGNNDYKVSKNVKIGDPNTKNDEGNNLYSYGQDIGDILLITDVDYPDFWFANGSGTLIELQKMETSKVPLENYQLKVEAMGSATQPLYTSADGTFTTCDTYAGGTAVTLNGSPKGASTASFYAPTGAGTVNQVLTSQGSGEPSWVSPTSTYTTTNNALKVKVFNQEGANGIWTNTVHTSGDQLKIEGQKLFDDGVGAVDYSGNNIASKIVLYQNDDAYPASSFFRYTKGNITNTIIIPTDSTANKTVILATTDQLNTTYLSTADDVPSSPITGDVWFVDITAASA